MSISRPIPVCEPFFFGNEKAAVLRTLDERRLSGGKFVEKFERVFSSYCSVKYGIATTSGTSALHLALRALGISQGDEVIIPDFTMGAVLFSVLYCGAKPVFVDAEPDTWNIDPREIKKKISRKTRAMIIVHTYGHPADMRPLMQIAREHGLYVVEDAAEAHGAEYNGRKCGSFGEAGCFSFYANKIITTGEGGMVVTSSPELANKCRYYRNLCFPLTGPRRYAHDDLGYNFRMTDIQAALGLAQMEHIDHAVQRRRSHAALYDSLLQDVPGVTLPVQRPCVKNVYWMYGIVIEPGKFGMTRDVLMTSLRRAGIETRPFFQPLHMQKVLRKFGITSRKDGFPVAKRLSECGIYLPSGTGLLRRQIQYISQKIRDLRLRKSYKIIK